MSDHVYKMVELVSSSTDNIEDAIQTAIKRADQTLRNLRWSEVAVPPATRALGQLRIRRHIDAIAHTYDLDRPF